MNNFNFSHDFQWLSHTGSMLILGWCCQPRPRMSYLSSGVQSLILIPPLSLPQDNGKAFSPGVLFQEAAQLTSTSPVRSLYLSRMTGSAVFSLRVLDRSLKGCSRAGEGEDRLISLSPRLKLLLCDPGSERTIGTKVLLFNLAGAGVCLLMWPSLQVAISGGILKHTLHSLCLGGSLPLAPPFFSDLSPHYIILRSESLASRCKGTF